MAHFEAKAFNTFAHRWEPIMDRVNQLTSELQDDFEYLDRLAAEGHKQDCSCLESIHRLRHALLLTYRCFAIDRLEKAGVKFSTLSMDRLRRCQSTADLDLALNAVISQTFDHQNAELDAMSRETNDDATF